MVAETYKAADTLINQASYLYSDLKPILITRITNIADSDSNSSLGLVISEQIGNRISQFGFPFVYLRLRKNIQSRENSGEFILSSDVKRVSHKYAATAVLVGTYAVAKKQCIYQYSIGSPRGQPYFSQL